MAGRPHSGTGLNPMDHPALSGIAIAAVASIEHASTQIEDVFAKVGRHLGSAHTIFGDLSSRLSQVSDELAGDRSESASIALQGVAARLRSLAEALPAETALLGEIGASSAQTSALLRELVKHVQMVTVISRSSRIEAASLNGNRGDFLNFTQEASDLANSVKMSVADCSKDHQRLSDALDSALAGQSEFERRYRDQLILVSADLIAVYAQIRDRQARSAELTASAGTRTRQIGEAVGSAIVSLQSGDSVRQRLEHIGHGLRKSAQPDAAPPPAGGATFDPAAVASPLILMLQGAQLEETVAGFEADIQGIGRTLATLSAGATSVVDQGRLLLGTEGSDVATALTLMKQKLAEATLLIAGCANAKKVVDHSISVLDEMLRKFHRAISQLGDTVIDITLIGMNAALKAAKLGAEGRAFVVIASELRATADHISAESAALESVLGRMAQSAEGLKALRQDDNSHQVAELETSIIDAIRDIEGSNGRVLDTISHLNKESMRFEGLMIDATSMMSAISKKMGDLPKVAERLQTLDCSLPTIPSADVPGLGDVFDELHATYTMVSERRVHSDFCVRFGLPSQNVEDQLPTSEADDVLFF